MRSVVKRAGSVCAIAACVAALAAPAFAGTRFGLSAGALDVRFADGDGDKGGLEREPQWAWGGSAGVVVEHAFTAGFGVVGGLEYAETPDVAHVTNHGLQFFNGGQAYEFAALWSIRQHVLVLPVRAEYRHGPLRAGIGPQVRYLVSAWRAGSELELVPLVSPAPGAGRPRPGPTAQIFEQVGTFDGSGDATDLYERWTLSALGSLGIAWPAGGHELRAEVRAWTDLTPATKDLGGGERATAFQFALGALW